VHAFVKDYALIAVLAPLLGTGIAGLFGKKIGKAGAHWSTIILMIVSFVASVMLFKSVVLDGNSFNGTIYTWGVSGSFQFDVGFLIDHLTIVMMMIVTFVSLAVHIYIVLATWQTTTAINVFSVICRCLLS